MLTGVVALGGSYRVSALDTLSAFSCSVKLHITEALIRVSLLCFKTTGALNNRCSALLDFRKLQPLCVRACVAAALADIHTLQLKELFSKSEQVACVHSCR